MTEQERPPNKQELILLKITSPVLELPQADLDFSNEEIGNNGRALAGIHLETRQVV
ncbi:hypothetical protein P7K49_022421 [Saguinus oedipus]|uniref:Uncharacterized protein n=1 Tax=Saguinus oedipus TaxID=9490 RepID=A0ABQ9UVB9_SAGOE|nr:hypothetical protein P7K49_022421 [Saguinus oedipus]